MPVDPAAILRAWNAGHPSYAYTVDAAERRADGSDRTARLRISYDAEARTESVRVVRGENRGTVLRWAGGSSIDVRLPGLLHIIPLKMPIRDPRALSPRKNDIRAGILARVAECYAGNAQSLHVERADAREIVLSIHDDRGIHCGDEYGDASVTRDEITLDAADGRPIMRERWVGPALVTRWVIFDVTPEPTAG